MIENIEEFAARRTLNECEECRKQIPKGPGQITPKWINGIKFWVCPTCAFPDPKIEDAEQREFHINHAIGSNCNVDGGSVTDTRFKITKADIHNMSRAYQKNKLALPMKVYLGGGK